MGFNSFWGNHFADLANRHKARTQSPLSLCRFTKKLRKHYRHYFDYDLLTQISFNNLSSRGRIIDSPKQSKKIINYSHTECIARSIQNTRILH
ncbi:hypothetical protein [Helicobacter sp. 23-1045]